MKRRNIIFILILFSALVFSIILPTFSKLKSGKINREWDNTVASSFNSGTGTENDPYIISNPSEFAFFATSLEDIDYDGKYIKLVSDIIINDGVFKTGEDITYLYNGELNYLDVTTSKYYSDIELTDEVGSINIFPTIDGFKGTLDGDFHTIYGYYQNGDGALFDHLEGSIKNMYIDNAFIYGGHLTSGLVLNADGADISNIVFNGNVIASKIDNNKVVTKTIPSFNVVDSYTISLENEIVKASKFVIKGSCDGDTFTLNNISYSCSNIEIELNTNDVSIIADDVNFDLEYDVYYNENKSAGIILNAVDSNISGIVNHGTIDNIISSGLVGNLVDSDLSDSYNDGSINGSYASGISDMIIGTSNVTNVYNNGIITSLNGSMFGNVIDSTLSIDKVFNKRDDKPIYNVSNSTITVTNSYSNTRYTDVDNIDFQLLSNQAYSYYLQYIDEDGIDDGYIWIHNDLPLLYFDDLKNKTVSVRVGTDSWNTYRSDVNRIIHNESVMVTVSASSIYKPIKDVYYYISSETISDLSNVSWTEYTKTFTLSDEGFYNIYVKYVDYNDVITYINSDTIILDFAGSDVSINMGDYTWTSSHTPSNIYNDNQLTYQITATDAISGISSVEYIISDSILALNDLELVDNWVSYSNSFTVSNSTPYIIYTKVTDNGGYITYVNSDYVVPATFHINNLKSGNNITFNSYMSSQSSFNFNITLDHTYINSTFTRYLYSSNELPNGTIIVVRDLNNLRAYKYVVDQVQYNNQYNGYLYALSDFAEIGKATFKTYFNNGNNASENYNISIDFKNTNAVGDYSFDFIAIDNNDTIRINSNESIVIHLSNVESNYLTLTSGTSSEANGVMTIPFTLTSNSQNSTDTKIENMYNGISISLVDELNNVIDRNNYSNIRFRYNGDIFVPDITNKVNICLGTNITRSFNLDILLADTNLEPGTYYFKITGYLSIDGVNKYYETSNSLRIPIVIPNKVNIDNYRYDITLNNSSIVRKGDIMSFDVDVNGITNPYVYVSLYKKKTLTAYNQEYVLVDLKDYVTDTLIQQDGKYLFDISNPIFNLDDDIESNGYKLVFELYDSDTKISEKEIKVIIK